MTQWPDDPGTAPPSLDDPDVREQWSGRVPPVDGAFSTPTEPVPVTPLPAPPPLPPAAQPSYPPYPPTAQPPYRPEAVGPAHGAPPPPRYPPLQRFPNGQPGAPNPAPNRPGGGRKVVAAVAAAAAVVVIGLGGFLVGDSLSDDLSTPTSSESAAPGGGSTVAASTATSVAAGQDGPVTKAPQLDPDVADEPAAAVNRAVSPAVVQIETSSGIGTGFIYDGQGYIMTAAHVVTGSNAFGAFTGEVARDVTVQLADGSKVAGTVLGADLNNDVAVVKIEPVDDMAVASLALGERPEVGTLAIAIGSPFGLDQTVTQGIVSATNRPVPSPNDNIVSMIQTDAAINSGNSGGPLVNRTGKVIGINTQIRTDSGDNAGIGFAVPIDLAYDVAQSLVAGKPIQLGYLGVRGDVPASGRTGAMVITVEAGSPAAKAGLSEGDVVTEADGQSIRNFQQLASIIRATPPGEKLTLRVDRNGRTIELEVTVGQATTR